MGSVEAAAAKGFENASGDVGAGGIEHGVVIGEGDAIQNGPIVIDVEGGPAAVDGLHLEQPIDGAALAIGLRLGAGGRGVLEGEQHHGGVVDVGVMLVGEFEGPTGRLDFGALHRPVAAMADFLGGDPAGGGGHGGARGFGQVSHFTESEHGDRGVPDGGEARLVIEAIGGFGEQAVELGDGADEIGMVARIAERIERHDAVHHGGVDGAEAVAVTGAVEHPLFGVAHGGAADILGAAIFPEFEDAVELMKEDGGAAAASHAKALAGGYQLVDVEARGDGADAAAGLDDGERDDDGAGPRGHLIKHVAGEENNFGGHGGGVFTRIKTEEAEIDFDVTVGRLDAAEIEDAAGGALQRLAVGREAGEFERDIGLDGSADVGGAMRIDIETAAGQLAGEDGALGFEETVPIGCIPDAIARGVEPQIEQDGIGFESGIGAKLAAPIAFGVLEREQGGGGALGGLAAGGGQSVRGLGGGRGLF